MDADRLYRDGVTQALAGFQLMEENLKIYIGMHFDCIRLLVDEKLYFEFSRSDYQEAALGRLINTFSKLCRNKALITDLRAIIRKRDHVAHQALLKIYSDAPLSPTDYIPHLKEINDLVQELPGLLQRIVNEMAELPKSLGSLTPNNSSKSASPRDPA